MINILNQINFNHRADLKPPYYFLNSSENLYSRESDELGILPCANRVPSVEHYKKKTGVSGRRWGLPGSCVVSLDKNKPTCCNTEHCTEWPPDQKSPEESGWTGKRFVPVAFELACLQLPLELDNCVFILRVGEMERYHDILFALFTQLGFFGVLDDASSSMFA